MLSVISFYTPNRWVLQICNFTPLFLLINHLSVSTKQYYRDHLIINTFLRMLCIFEHLWSFVKVYAFDDTFSWEEVILQCWKLSFSPQFFFSNHFRFQSSVYYEIIDAFDGLWYALHTALIHTSHINSYSFLFNLLWKREIRITVNYHHKVRNV